MASSVMNAAGRGDQRPISRRIGKYEVEAEIGHSAIIQVFRAFDRDTGRPVTLKVLTGVADRPLLERFRREVACAANLRNPSIIAIYELGEHVGLPFAAMQHLGGDDLRRAIQAQRPTRCVPFIPPTPSAKRNWNSSWMVWRGCDPTRLHRR